jgi:hypothetical protein
VTGRAHPLSRVQTHVARLKHEEEALARQASEKRVTALTELRSFLKEVSSNSDACARAREVDRAAWLQAKRVCVCWALHVAQHMCTPAAHHPQHVQNDEYIQGKHEAAKQARKDEAEAVKKSEVCARVRARVRRMRETVGVCLLHRPRFPPPCRRPSPYACVQMEATLKEQQREADIARRAEDMRKRMDKMTEVYREEVRGRGRGRQATSRRRAAR